MESDAAEITITVPSNAKVDTTAPATENVEVQTPNKISKAIQIARRAGTVIDSLMHKITIVTTILGFLALIFLLGMLFGAKNVENDGFCQKIWDACVLQVVNQEE